MAINPILDVPLGEVMSPTIALPLQMLRIFTVGGFLRAWSDEENHWQIEQLFDTPEQAHHAAAVCATWLGVSSGFVPFPAPVQSWWRRDEHTAIAA